MRRFVWVKLPGLRAALPAACSGSTCLGPLLGETLLGRGWQRLGSAGGGCAQPCRTSSDLGNSPSVSVVLLMGTGSTKHRYWFHPVPVLTVSAVW